jgi:CHAT domain-containing protein
MGGVRGSIAEDAGGAAGVGLMSRLRYDNRASNAGLWLGIACSVLLLFVSGPGRAAAASRPQPVAARQCLPIDSSHPVASTFAAPADGLLRVELEERGISTVSLVNDVAASAAAAPIDRLGTVVLAAKVHRGERTKVAVRVDDSPDVRGEICVSAELIAPDDILRTQAELDFAAGGRATRATEWAAAFSRYLSAARGFDNLGLRLSAARARHAMAELTYLRFDRKRDTYALVSQALADYGHSANPALLGELATLEGKTLLDMPGVKPKAVAEDVRRWLATGRRYDNAVWYGAREVPRIDIMTGFLEFMLDDPARSREIFITVAASCRELRDWDCYAIARQNSALLAEEDKNYSVALAAYADALRLLPPELDLKLSADIWNNLGRLQGVVGLFSASERSHAAAMRAFAKLGDCLGVRRSLVRSGDLRVHVGNLADGESDLERAGSYTCPNLLASASLPANQPSGDPVLELNRAQRDGHDVGLTNSEHPCAHPVDPAPLTTESKIVVFDSVLSLGNAAMMTGDSTEVWRCLDAAAPYAVSSRTQVRLANARGAAYLDRKDPMDARAAFTRALRIADEADLPATYEHRGPAQFGLANALLLSGKVADSLSQAYRVLEVSTQRGDVESTITSLRLIAAGYRSSGQPAQAIHVLQVAADLIEAVPIDELDGEQRATFLASQHTVFAELTDLYASQGGADDSTAWLAFDASERGRSRSLRYALNQETRNAASAVLAPPAAKYQQLLSEVASVQHQAGPPSELIDAIDRIALHETGPAPAFDRAQLGRTLRQLDATLVEYASGSTGTLAFIVSGEHVKVVHLGDAREIAAATAQLRERLRDTEAPPGEVREAAQALARLVLWPITPFLREGRVVVVPDDALHTVPLAVLPWGPDPNQQLVLQHTETTVIPSALFLMRVHPGASAHSEMPRLALVGDPVFRVSDWRKECTDTDEGRKHVGSVNRSLAWTESLPRLPGSRTEVTSIARLARESRPASRVETLVGCAAVPTALRKAADSDVDLLHIATHARIDAQRPRLSALALTPESAADSPASTFGLLDILGLKLNSKLVVLSACDTSRGRLLPGEGVLGPAQAFLQAGSAAVLASYWRVDDEITATFMQRFYKYLLVDRLSASAALRKTQLESAASGKTYEWAAFSLYGWPDSSI